MVFDELDEVVVGIYPVEPKKQPQPKAVAQQKAKKPVPKKTPKADHVHPSEEGKNVIVEVRPEYIGSLGEIDDEGCNDHEHGNLRFVLTDKIVEEVSSDKSKLAEYMVISEILGKPKCKR